MYPPRKASHVKAHGAGDNNGDLKQLGNPLEHVSEYAWQ
jgi:hypothetical protein